MVGECSQLQILYFFGLNECPIDALWELTKLRRLRILKFNATRRHFIRFNKEERQTVRDVLATIAVNAPLQVGRICFLSCLSRWGWNSHEILVVSSVRFHSLSSLRIMLRITLLGWSKKIWKKKLIFFSFSSWHYVFPMFPNKQWSNIFNNIFKYF